MLSVHAGIRGLLLLLFCLDLFLLKPHDGFGERNKEGATFPTNNLLANGRILFAFQSAVKK